MMKKSHPQNRSILHRTALATALAATLATIIATTTPAQARDQNHPVFMLGGNEFIIRKMPAGRGKIYLYAYRLAGDQWERHSIATIDPRSKRRGNTIPERIYYTGRRIGTVRVDLDNPMNTDLNLYPGR